MGILYCRIQEVHIPGVKSSACLKTKQRVQTNTDEISLFFLNLLWSEYFGQSLYRQHAGVKTDKQHSVRLPTNLCGLEMWKFLKFEFIMMWSSTIL